MQTLEQAFNFTPDDLAANEAGHTTPSQRNRLNWLYMRNIIGGFLLFNICFVGIPVLMALGDEDVEFIGVLGRAVGLCTLPTGILSALLLYSDTRVVRASRQRVRKICGAVILQTVPVKHTFEYKLHIGGQASELSKEQFAILKSGEHYCVYFLPAGSKILSIRPAVNIHQPAVSSSDRHFQTLKTVLDFTPQDIAENEAGQLSHRQRSRVWWRACEEALTLLMGCAFLYTFILIIGLAANPANDHPHFYKIPEVTFICFILMSPVPIGLWYSWRKARIDIQNGRVEQLCGQVKTGIYTGVSLATHLSITIERERFKVSGKVVNAVQDNAHYCIYYAPVSRVIVSIKLVK